jgi:hypothetical protein
MTWVKQQDCIQCGADSHWTIVDHMYGSAFRHNNVLIGHWALLPLCHGCDLVKTNGSHNTYKDRFGETQAQTFMRFLNKVPEELRPPQEVVDAIEDWGR